MDAVTWRRVAQDMAAVRLWVQRVHYRSRSAFFTLAWTLAGISAVCAVVVGVWAMWVPAAVVYAATAPLRWTTRAVWKRQCLAADLYAIDAHKGRVHTQDWRQPGPTTGAKWQEVAAYERKLTPKLTNVERTPLRTTATVYAPPGQTVDLIAKRGDRVAAGMWHKVIARSDGDDPGKGDLVILRHDPFGADMVRDHPGFRGRTDVWDDLLWGWDEEGNDVHVPLIGKSFLIGGLLGSGKSVTATNIVSHFALDPTVPMYIIDGAGTDMRPFAECVDPDDPTTGGYAPLGPPITQSIGNIIELLERLWNLVLARQMEMASGDLDSWRRKVERGEEPPVLLVVDEWATIRDQCTKAQTGKFDSLLLSILSNCRKNAVVPVLITQQPRFDVVPPKLRNLCLYRWAGHVGSDSQSDIILGDGWADDDVSAKDIRSDHVGVGYLADGNDRPYLVRSYHLDDDAVRRVALRAADMRREFRGVSHTTELERV